MSLRISLNGSTISHCGLYVLHWQRPSLTLDRGCVNKAESHPLVGDQIQDGALQLGEALPCQCLVSAPK